MIKVKFLTILAVCVSILLVNCESSLMSDTEIIKKHNLSKVDVDVAGVSNEFGINLLKQLSQDDKDTDVFFSPFPFPWPWV